MSELEPETNIVIGMVTAGDALPAGLFRQIDVGMRAYFPQYSWRLAHACSFHDAAGGARNCSNPLITLPVSKFGVHHVTFPCHGVPAKTNGYHAILQYARKVKARVCLLVDPAQLGFECNWIDSLIRPGLHSRYDMVTPIYAAGANGQILTRNLLSPMFRALFGAPLKQPMAGELLLSGRLVRRLLARSDWDSAPARNAPELWMTFVANAEGFRIAESAVGSAAYAPRRTLLAAHDTVRQLVTSLFTLVEQYEGRWSASKPEVNLDCFGSHTSVSGAPGHNVQSRDGVEYLTRFSTAFGAFRAEWQSILDPHTFRELETFHHGLQDGSSNWSLPGAAWARLVYETAAAWKHRTLPRDQVAGLFTPLLFARAGSFLLTNRWKEQREIDSELARLGGIFEALFPAFLKLWRGEAAPSRANPAPACARTMRGVEAA